MIIEEENVVYKIFHLGKKAYTFRYNNDDDIVLFGTSKCNYKNNKCEICIYYTIVNKLDIMEIHDFMNNPNTRILGIYHSRSKIFLNGKFSDFDSQRYLKSRYRHIIRDANRKRNHGLEVKRILDEYHRNYLSDLNVNENKTLSIDEIFNQRKNMVI